MTGIDQVFEALFFGSGGILGLILLVILVFAAASLHKFVKVIMVPVSIIIAVWYFSNASGTSDLMWGGILFLFVAIVMTVWAVESD